MTEITDVKVEEGKYKKIFEEAIKEYLSSRRYVYEENMRPQSLMDLGTINMKEIRKKASLRIRKKQTKSMQLVLK